MKISTKQIVEFAGVAAIVLSLVLVASELRQSNRIAIATAEAELRSSQREVNSLIAESPELAAVLAKSKDSSVQLDPVEDQILRGYATAQFSVLAQANASAVNGLLTPYSVNIYTQQITTMLDRYPLMTKHWVETTRNSNLSYGISAMWDSLLDALADRGYEN